MKKVVSTMKNCIRRGSGQPQGIAPTMVTITLWRLIRSTVGAIPCGRPALTAGAYFTRIVPCGCPEPRLSTYGGN